MPRHVSGRDGFTLIEVMLASVMAAMILLAVYLVFSHAIKLRDNATQRLRSAQLRARASRTIRADLQNAWISGGSLANVLESSTSTSAEGADSAVPGYFRFTTTTGKDTPNELYGDVQEVEYYIAKDDSVPSATHSGKLVRVLTRDLLENSLVPANEELLLANVQTFSVSFYDGNTWQTSWSLGNTTGANSTATTATSTASATTGVNLPQAVRIDIQQVAPTDKENVPPPLEITVPWTAQPFAVSPTT